MELVLLLFSLCICLLFFLLCVDFKQFAFLLRALGLLDSLVDFISFDSPYYSFGTGAYHNLLSHCHSSLSLVSESVGLEGNLEN